MGLRQEKLKEEWRNVEDKVQKMVMLMIQKRLSERKTLYISMVIDKMIGLEVVNQTM